LSQSSHQFSSQHPAASSITLPSASFPSHSSSSMPPPLPSVLSHRSGICLECGAPVKITATTGVLYRHGHGHGRPACPGSGQPPESILPQSLNAAADSSFVEPVSQRADTTGDFVIRPPSRATLKRIPRGARQKAALSLESHLRALLAAPTSLDNWMNVLQFASSLSQPQRGGKRHNLTSQIVSQIVGYGNPPSGMPQAAPTQSRKMRQTEWDKGGDDSAVRRASVKLQEGDIRGAVRSLCSEETLARFSPDTFQTLLAKHPPGPIERFVIPSTTTQPMIVSSLEVKKAIRSFGPGSAGGRDGLRPQHLKDMTEDRVGSSLAEVLAKFSNLVLSGGVPIAVRPIFFGATLFPFIKKDGGIRPIAVGLTLRRLVAKIANSRALDTCAAVLGPSQLGVGVKGGAEALVHSARLFVQRMDESRAFVKLDFTNAFNSVQRAAVFEAVAEHRPDLLAFTESAYGSPSHLWVGVDSVIASAEGVQQGDPLGPLLFCLALDKPLKEARCEFRSGYLDDVALGDTVANLIDRVRSLETAAEKIGLKLNHSKCEVFGLNPLTSDQWTDSGLNFIRRSVKEATLLGSPIHPSGTDPALVARREQLEQILPRLYKLTAHEALFLLRSSFAIPRLQYLLRTSPCSSSTETTRFDEIVREALASICNARLNSDSWSQASLPIRWGGIGVRSTVDLAPSAFLSSLLASSSIIHNLLPPWALLTPDQALDEATSRWLDLGGVTAPAGSDNCSQKAWDDGICASKSARLLNGAGPVDRARLLASVAPGSGSWLHALPCTNLGLHLSNEELRIGVGLRLGAPLVRPHRCVCGAEVEQDGRHGLSCRRSAGRHRRHALANDVIVRAIRSIDVHAELEPPRLLSDDRRRPDGATLDPWNRGKYLVWDFTCPDTLAPSHLNRSSTAAGSVAVLAEERKRTKYSQLVNSGLHIFVPIAIETLGAWGPAAQEICAEIGGRIARCTGDVRSPSFLRQRLDIAIQKGNAAAVLGTLHANVLA
jgi:hypothetical protein